MVFLLCGYPIGIALISNDNSDTVQRAEYHSKDLLYTKIFFSILIIDIIISVITDLIIRLVASPVVLLNVSSRIACKFLCSPSIK